jgi:hypothetical protein
MEQHGMRALRAYSYVAAVGVLVTPLVFILGIGQQPGDLSQGEAFRELLQAARALPLYRVALVGDTALWFFFAGSLALLAQLLRPSTPARAALIGLCAAGTLLGAVTGCLRLTLVASLAERWAADATAHSAILEQFVFATRVANATALAGNLLLGLGFALSVWGLWSLREFPRWLTAWMALTAAIPLLQASVVASGRGFIIPLVIAEIVLGFAALHVVMAVALRKV